MRWTVLVCLLVTAPAAAEPPITNRDYAIDFYEGTAIGDTRMVGMGGTGLALIPGSAGTLLNASAPAVRQATDNDSWSWDWHFDYLNGRLSSDFDNNGEALDDATGAQLGTVGLAFRRGKWAAAIVGSAQTAPIDGAADLDAQNLRVRIAVARWFERIDTSIGIGVQSIAFQILTPDEAMFDISGGGLIAGATWLPRMENFRVAGTLESAIIGGDVKTEACDPMACMVEGSTRSYILPNQVESSFRTGAGFAYRWAETAWNQQVRAKFRDELSVTAAADVWVTGASKNGYGIEKFGVQELQRSGSHANVGARAGVEVEALPGRLRLRVGAYWEPARFNGVGGRMHGTFGVEGRVFEFQLWGTRRGRLGVTTDIASRYRNIALSIGFWH
ncbi:MAG: hypothetical protein M4D80_23640 [Myxococcota bacterium]|nr:hypothetical protein [Myxococcota bacterium]